jgi:hypothetical protein
VLVATLAMILPSMALGDSAMTAMRVGPEWLRPVALSVRADCGSSRVICITENQGSRLDVERSDIIVDGLGHTVPGIRVEADNVTIQNFRVTAAASTGIWVRGDGITVRNNDITQVYYDGDDVDAMRFFGDHINILYNAAYDIVMGDKGDAHVDCAQTWASPTYGSSSDILIEGNECWGPEFDQCLMAEGPDSTDGGGGGSGDSRRWTVRGNYYECHANQTIAFRDIDDALIEDNNFQGAGNKAIQLTDGSDDVTIRGNTLGPAYGSLVGD